MTKTHSRMLLYFFLLTENARPHETQNNPFAPHMDNTVLSPPIAGARVTKTQQARVSTHSAVIPKVPGCTQRQRVLENTPYLQGLDNQQVSEVTPLNVLKGAQKSEANPGNLSSGRAYSVYNPGSTHSAPIPRTRESTMDSAVSERHIPNGRDHLSDQSDLCWQNQPIQEPWVIQTVLEGYYIPLLSVHLQQSPPCNPHLSTEDAAIYWRKRYSPSCRSRPYKCMSNFSSNSGFYSNMFIVPKKDGDQRPALKHLNKFVKSEHFKIEGLHTVKALLRRSQSLLLRTVCIPSLK